MKAEFDAADLTAEGKDNASVTILDKDADGVIRILIESEDHLMRANLSGYTRKRQYSKRQCFRCIYGL